MKMLRNYGMKSKLLLSKLPSNETIFSSITRFQSRDEAKLISNLQAEELTDKGLIRISGDEVKNFLQGLITNDIRHLENGRSSIYSMFLNIKGRILYDSIIYRTKEENVFILECDKSGLIDLEKHLKMFRVRKKIDISDASDELKVWTIFSRKNVFDKDLNIFSQAVKNDDTLEEYLIHLLSDSETSVYKDSRMALLGFRLITSSSSSLSNVLEKNNIELSNDFNYRCLRYKLGVGEGATELPPGKCFPHEANCDFLHGVSFHKGCYIGQELTSRTQHTGVVRKRLMPLEFLDSVNNCSFDTPVLDVEKKLAIGKLRGTSQNYAIALMRIVEALEAKTLKAGDFQVCTHRPIWWPVEVPKEKFSVV